MMRIGMIGCGHIGTVHSYGLRQLTRADLIDAAVTATYDTDADRAAKLASHHHAQPCASIEELLDGVDIAWISTWTAGHLDAVRQCVDRNIAVFCEKPLAPSIDDCRDVAALLSRVPHQVGLVLRHAPAFAMCADIVRSGAYGRVLATTFRDDQYFPIQGMYGSTWRSDPTLAGGGTLIEHSIHDIDLLNWILGVPTSVRASVAERFGYAGIEDTATVLLDYADSSQAVMVSVWHQILSRGSTRRLEIFCEAAHIWTEDDYLGPVYIHTNDGVEERVAALPDWAARLDVPEVYEKSVVQYAAAAKVFCDALSDGRRSGHPDASTALAAHEIVAAAYRSARSGGGPEPVAL